MSTMSTFCYNIEHYRNNKNRINWNAVSKYHALNEDIIREFQDNVDWKEISRYQILSENFK